MRHIIWVLAAGLAIAGCTSHRVTVDPIEVKPIHLTVDINLKVDRELEDFFDFEEEADPAPAPSAIRDGGER